MLSLMACVMSARMGTAARPCTQCCASEILIPESRSVPFGEGSDTDPALG
jgi:hypothetical protein